jgi:hypothetical protein
MIPAPKWLKSISLAVTTTVGFIFYGVGLHDNDDTLIYSGVVLIMIGLLSWVASIKVTDNEA